MSTVLRVTFVLALVLGAGGLVWWLLLGFASVPPDRHSIDGLTAQVSIHWTEEGPVEIEASSSKDALAALGYAHGMKRGWSISMWRRTALGTLASWFGEKTVPLDRHSRRLGFARHAREAFAHLPPSDQQRLKAYSRGLTAALRSPRVHTQDPFLVLDVMPQAWKPWHTLAVQRLLAWMGTDPSSLQVDSSEAVASFRSTDRLLRRWLHLHGWDQSVTWAARSSNDTTGTLLFSRHVLGASAEPLIQEITLRRPETPPVKAATVPGTFLFPTGTTNDHAWALLLNSSARVERVPLDTTRLTQWYERISPKEGNERLIQVRRHGEALLFQTRTSSQPADSIQDPLPQEKEASAASGTAAPDTAVVLTWPGLSSHSDVPAWTQLASLRRSPASGATSDISFQLFHNEGLEVLSSGRWRVRGHPPIVEEDAETRTILVGRSSWARHQAQSLEALQQTSRLNGARWSASDSSTWAANLLPRLISDLDPFSTVSPYDEALSYLENWDYVYESASIGAAVFDQWMRAYRREIGHIPTVPDTTYLAAPRRRNAFEQAIDTLVARYGSDVRRWRWERIAPDHRYFPVWAADSLVASDLEDLSTTRYAPLDRPGHGHASSLSGGPTLVRSPPLGPAPTQWEGWVSSDEMSLTVRRLRFDPTRFFARPLMPEERPPAVSLDQIRVTSTTKLVPPPP